MTDFVEYGSFCAEHPDVETASLLGPGQQDFSEVLSAGFRDWLPWPFILSVRVAGRVPCVIVREFMKGGRPFLRVFARPHRLSWMRPTASGWYESRVILFRDALDLKQGLRRLAEHVRETPTLDRGYED